MSSEAPMPPRERDAATGAASVRLDPASPPAAPAAVPAMAALALEESAAPAWRARLAAVLDRRFARFAAVGASGVVVNLGSLFVLADLMRTNPNLASAGAIAISIGSNFLLNDAWTFGDRRDAAGGRAQRMLRFYTVSLGGAAVQWGVFVGANLALSSLVADGARSLTGAGWKYLCQLTGIAVGTVWNFSGNLLWTWRPREGRET